MYITNLTGKYKYHVDPRFVSKCFCPSAELSEKIDNHWIGDKLNLGVQKESYPFFENYSRVNFIDIINAIPIYLVSRMQSMQTIKVETFGHTEDVLVPKYYTYKNPLPMNKGNWDMKKVKPEMFVDIYEGTSRDKDLDYYTILDNFGLYTRISPKGRFYRIGESKPKIFIWVDKIMMRVKKDWDLYKILTTQVILHELAHAMMDIGLVYGRLWPHEELEKEIPYTYFILKEESYATAISLSMMKNNVSEQEWKYLLNEIDKEPLQYKLGLDYMVNNGAPTELTLTNWLVLKESGSFFPEVMKFWIRHVQYAHPRYIYDMVIMDDSIDCPLKLYRYNSRYYESYYVCVTVIKDYVKQHPNITRKELHKAFPDSINEEFPPLLDYPENSEFKGKHDYNRPKPVDPEFIVNCSDGQVAICPSWYPRKMSKFIKNAAKLGIKIDHFKEHGIPKGPLIYSYM